MINKRFELIDKSDIDSLIVNQVPESRTIDYKEELLVNTDGDRKEFLADVSSFANASGGDLLYGIQERRDKKGQSTGLPEIANGLDGINSDTEIRRLENIIRDGIAPRISNVQLAAIEGFSKGAVIVIRIPKSWTSPHMVTFKNHSRFYSRNSAGKYPLDVTEIRSAFVLSESLPEKIINFRDERIAKIVAGETPVLLGSGLKIVLHLLPITSLTPGTQIDLTSIRQHPRLVPMRVNTWDYRYNFDGFLNYSTRSRSLTGNAYLQVFRNGIIESVFVFSRADSKKIIPSLAYEEDSIKALENYLLAEKEFGFNPPVFVMLSLVDVKGYEMSSAVYNFSKPSPIDRNVLLLPEAIVEDYNSKASDILRPAFDTVWQSAGEERSLNYDENGNWIGDRGV
jgi:hypothetical protein